MACMKTNYYSSLMPIKHHSSSALRNSHQTGNAGRLEGGAPALDILDLGVQLAILHGSGGEGGGRLPLGGSAGSGLLHHLVDLLEGQTLGLRNEEVGVDERTSAEASPHEEDAGLEVALIDADHVRGDDSDDSVPEPVGGGGKGNTTGADREREDLANDDPGTRTPGAGKEEDEDGDEGDLGVDGRDVDGTSLTSG